MSKVVRGKTPCRLCSIAWTIKSHCENCEQVREPIRVATGRDGRCTMCRAYVRINRKMHHWDVKYSRGGFPLAWVAYVDDRAWEIYRRPKGDRPGARWRRRIKHRRPSRRK